MNETSFSIDSLEGPYNTGRKYENGNIINDIILPFKNNKKLKAILIKDIFTLNIKHKIITTE